MQSVCIFNLSLCILIINFFTIAAQHSDCNVRVMVVFTQSALTKQPGILANIKNAITDTNDAFTNSKINEKVTLCRVMKINDTEGGDDMDEGMFSTDIHGMQVKLNKLIYSNVVADERRKCDADIVIGITDKCFGRGLAATVGAKYWQDGFAIMDESRLKANDFTFTHEVGHILGAKHDKANWGPAPLIDIDWLNIGTDYSYAYGKVDDKAPGQYRTIMAYWNSCVGGAGNCPSIKYFSNPDITVNGEKIGSATENNARALNTHIPFIRKLDELDRVKDIVTPTVIYSNEVAHYAASESISIDQMTNYGECTITAPTVTIKSTKGIVSLSNNVHITNLGPCDGFNSIAPQETENMEERNLPDMMAMDGEPTCSLMLSFLGINNNVVEARWEQFPGCHLQAKGIIFVTTPLGDVIEQFRFENHPIHEPLMMNIQKPISGMFIVRVIDHEGNSLRKFVVNPKY